MPVDSNPQAPSSPAPAPSTIYTINTKFNPKLDGNKTVEYPMEKIDSDGRYKFTEMERKSASKSQEPSSLEELSQQVGVLVIYFTFY